MEVVQDTSFLKFAPGESCMDVLDLGQGIAQGLRVEAEARGSVVQRIDCRLKGFYYPALSGSDS